CLQASRPGAVWARLPLRGGAPEWVRPPPHSLAVARQALEALPAGGTTPLGHGLAAARKFIGRQQRRQPHLPIWTVLLTDGRTNVPLTSNDPWRDAVTEAQALGACGSGIVVVG